MDAKPGVANFMDAKPRIESGHRWGL